MMSEEDVDCVGVFVVGMKGQLFHGWDVGKNRLAKTIERYYRKDETLKDGDCLDDGIRGR